MVKVTIHSIIPKTSKLNFLAQHLKSYFGLKVGSFLGYSVGLAKTLVIFHNCTINMPQNGLEDILVLQFITD